MVKNLDVGYYAIVIRGRRVLMVEHKKKYDIFPGGKPDKDESIKNCILREIEEELSKTKVVVGDYYDAFEGQDPLSDKIKQVNNYFCHVEGDIGKPSGEVISWKFVNSRNMDTLRLTDSSRQTLVSLIGRGFVD